MKNVKINRYLYDVEIKIMLNRTYMSSSQEFFIKVRHYIINFSLTEEKYPFFLTCFYIFDDDLSQFVHILSLCQETEICFVHILSFCQETEICF